MQKAFILINAEPGKLWKIARAPLFSLRASWIEADFLKRRGLEREEE